MQHLMRFICSLILMFSYACQKNDPASLSVHVKDDTGKTIEGAVISLNGTEIGQSDANGNLLLNLPLKKGEHRLEVYKKSEKLQFTRFRQDFLYYRDDDKKINIDAILYSSPLWSYESEGNKTVALASPDSKEASPITPPPVTRVIQTAELAKEKPLEKIPKKTIESKAVIAKTVLKEAKNNSIVLKQNAKIRVGNKILADAKVLLSKGKSIQAILLLKKVPANSPVYEKSWEMIGDIYLKNLSNPEKAIVSYSKVTDRTQVKRSTDSKYVKVYTNKAMAYFQLAEKPAHKKDSLRLLKNSSWLSKKAISLLKKDAKPEATWEALYYYNALSLHRIWEKTHNPKMAIQVKTEWKNYQIIAKNLKKSQNKNFYVNSEIYKKQIPL